MRWPNQFDTEQDWRGVLEMADRFTTKGEIEKLMWYYGVVSLTQITIP